MIHTEFPITSFSQASRVIANEPQSFRLAVLFHFKEVSQKVFGSITKLGLYEKTVVKSGDSDLLKAVSESDRGLLWYAVAADIIASMSDQDLVTLLDYWKDFDREIIRIVDSFLSADRILSDSRELDMLDEETIKDNLTAMAADDFAFLLAEEATLSENVSAFLLSLLLKLPIEQLLRVTSVIYDEL